MADLGTLDTRRFQDHESVRLRINTYVFHSYGNPIQLQGRDPYRKAIQGLVLGADSAPVEAWVALYHRETKQLAGLVRSGADGSYKFDDLKEGVEYAVVAFDDTGGTEYNAVIFDRVIPA